jgi:glyoxylase-like metal-dependent hydrolase (beta-lactamase superfamily II)
VISAATAGVVFGLDKTLEFIPSAFAQAPNAAQAEKGFVKFKVGDIQVTQIYDGLWEKAHDPGFIKNASVDDTKAALKAAGQTDEFVPVTFTITVVEIGGKTIMFDSGTGGQTGGPKAGLLAKENLAKAGIDASKISTIMVTHFHGDHIFGLMAKDTNEAVYPNAEIVMPEAEYKFWTDPATLEKLPAGAQGLAKRIQAVFPTWKNIKQVGYDQDVGSGIRSVNTNGHTPGHTSYLMGSAGSQLLVSGDITNIPALNMKNPGWHLVFDANAALAEENRRKTFERAIADKIVVTGYHFGMPGAGTIVKDGGGYAYVPVSV